MFGMNFGFDRVVALLRLIALIVICVLLATGWHLV